jgi:hypothetical protein
MYNNGLTQFSTRQTYYPQNFTTREQAAKFFSVLAKNIFGRQSTINTQCTFTDIFSADPTLRADILEACRLGIFQ